nr:MAG TPA: tail tape measure [Caudoviricetes sp.]
MSSIDERVVQMQFENSQFEKGIKETIKSLGLLKQNLNVDKATESIEHLQNVGNSFSLSNISRSLDKIVERTSWAGRTIRREIDLLTGKAVNLGKSLTVGQIDAGWSKYEQKTASVQTIMNATGKSIDEVNGYLDKLMWFSDETSYNFTEMTAALGTLTSSGGDINKMIPMIEGMATATAFAGKSASEFSRVIYNLNQSYSQGYLSLMDWKSVELAQVGSEQLKQTLIDTAVELGTLKKLADGTFETKKGTVVNAGNMGSTLNEKWATKEVMEGAFGKFAQVIEEAYKLVEAGEFDTAADAIASLADKYDETYYKAAKAAQEAKSFKEAIDATADAVSSGWMKTFELIFGNYDEARVLWTDLANALWEVFASGAEQRNEVLQAWKEAGGRADLIQGITDALTALWTVIRSIGEAFHDIFPQATTDDLLNFSSKVKELGANLRDLARAFETVSAKRGELVTKTDPLQEYFGELSKGSRGDEVKKLQEALEAKGFSVGKHGIDGIFGKDTEAALKAFQESIGETADGLYKESDHAKLVGTVTASNYELVFETIKKYTPFVDKLQRIARGIFAIFGMVGDAIGFVGKALWNVLSILSPVANAFLTLMAAAGDGIVAFREWVKNSRVFDKWLSSIKRKLQPVKRWLEDAGKSFLEFFGFDAAGKKIDGVSKFATTLANVKTFLRPVLDWFSTAYDDIKKFFGIGAEMYENGELVPDRGPSPFVQKLIEIKEKLQPVFDWFTGIRDKIKGFFGIGQETYENGELVPSKFAVQMQKAKQLLQPVFDWFSTAYANVKKFFGIGVEAEEGGKKVTGFTDVWQKAKAILRPVFDWFSTAYENVKKFFGIGVEADESGKKVTGFADAWAKVKAYLQPVFDWFVNAYANMKKFFGIGQEIYENGELVPSGFSIMFEKAKQKVQNVIDWFKNAFNGKTLGESLANFWNSFTGLFKAKEGEIGFLNILKTIGNTMSSVFNWINDNKWWILAASGIYFLIIAPITKLLGWVKGLVDTWNTATGKVKPGGDGKKGDGFAKSIQQIGIGIGLIAASLFLIGKMKPEELTRAAWTLVGLIGGIIAIGTIGSKIAGKNLSAVTDYMKQMSRVILVTTAAVWILGKMSPAALWQGSIALLAIQALLLGFMKLAQIMDAQPAQTLNVSVKLKGLLAMAAGIFVIAMAVKSLSKLEFGSLVKGLFGVTIIMTMLYALMQVASGLPTGTVQIVGLLSVAATVWVLVQAMKTLGGMDPEKFKQAAIGIAALTGVIAAMVGIFALAGMLNVGLIAGAASIGAAFVVLTTIVVAFLTFIGFLNRKGNITRLIDSAAGVMKAIGRVFGSIIGGFMEAIGEGIGAINKGASGLSDAKHFEKDLEAAFTAIQKVTEFLAKFQKERAFMQYDPSAYKKLMQILDNIKQFGEAIGAVSEGINGLSKTKYEADTNAAIQVMNSVAEALIGLQEFGNQNAWEKKVTGGISSWWETTETMIGQVLSDIEKFASVVGTVREAVSGLSKDQSRDADGNKTATVLQDTNVAAEMMKQVADVLSELNDLASSKTWVKPKLTILGIRIGTELQLQGLLENVKLFGDVVGTVRDGVAGLASDKDKNGNSKVLADVDVADQMVQKVTEALGSLSDLTKDETWATPISLVNQIFTGYSTAIDPVLDTLDKFGDVMKSIYDAVSGVSLDKNGDEYVAETQTTVATTVVDKVVKYLQSLNGSKGFGSFATEGQELEDWLFTNQSLVNQLVEDLNQFTPQMNSILTTVKDLADSSTEADAQTAIDAVTIVANFLAGIGDLNIEKSRNFFSKLFNGDTKTGSLMDHLSSFGSQIQKMFANFSGMSESSIEADAATAFSILREFTNLVTWLGSTERPGNIVSDLGILTQVTNLLGGLGSAITIMSDELEGANLDTIQQISDFLSSLNGMLSGIKGAEDVAKLFNDLKSLFTDGEGDENSGIPTWLQSIDSDKATTKLTQFTQSFLKNAKPDFESLKNEFHDVGYNLAVGMGDGLFSGTEVAKLQAAAFANAVLSKIKSVLGINSPSKKTFEFGRYTVLGFAKGINDHSRIAEKSMQGMSNGILAQLSQDMDFDPVVRPIVDLSDVVSSSRKMDGLLTTNRSVALAGVATGAVNRYKAEKNGRTTNATSENGAANVSDTTSVNVNGNFYIRNDQDVKSLASEIATLTKQQQRSLGATY